MNHPVTKAISLQFEPARLTGKLKESRCREASISESCDKDSREVSRLDADRLKMTGFRQRLVGLASKGRVVTLYYPKLIRPLKTVISHLSV